MDRVPKARASRPSAIAAARLAAAGHKPQAIVMLNRLMAEGDRDSMFTLAMWRLAGELVPRDVSQARDLFRRAAEAGRLDAAKIHLNFLASGTGGPANWRAAMGRLRTLARHDPSSRADLDLIEKMRISEDGEPAAVPEAEALSASPRAFRLSGLFSPEECDYLVERAAPMMRPSVVVDERTGKETPHPIRSSDGAVFPWLVANPAIHALCRRIAAASGTDVEQGEPLQVLRYRRNQQYRSHLDAIAGLDNQRIITVIVYLTDDYEGGATQFANGGPRFRGGKGDALLFHNVLADGRPDPASQHAGLPVAAGSKLIASRWIRARPFVPPS